MFLKNTFILTMIFLLFIFSFPETTKHELLFVIDKNSDQENVVIDMIKKINNQKEDFIKSVFVVFYTYSIDFEIIFYYDIFKNFIGLQDNEIRNEYRKARDILENKIMFNFFYYFICKNETCIDLIWVLENDFYEKLLILDIIKYQNDEISAKINSLIYIMMDLVIDYHTRLNIIITSENNKRSNFQDHCIDSLNSESLKNYIFDYNYNKLSAQYTLVKKKDFIINYDSEYKNLIKEIILSVQDFIGRLNSDAYKHVKGWIFKQKIFQPANLVFFLIFVIFEIQNDLFLQNYFNRNNRDEYYESLFYNECSEVRFSFENLVEKHSRTNDLLKNAGIFTIIIEENKMKNIFDHLQKSLETYNNEEILNIINTYFDQIEQESDNELEKTEVEYLFTNFTSLFFEPYKFSLRMSLVFAAFCIKNETIFKNLAIQYLKFQDSKLVNFDLKIYEKENFDFAIYMFEVMKYFGEEYEVDKWKKIHIFKKLREIQKTKTSVEIGYISSDEKKHLLSYINNFFNFFKYIYYGMKSIIISESQPTLHCRFCKKNIDNIRLTSIKWHNRCHKCIQNNHQCYFICKPCLQSRPEVDLQFFYEKICCLNRFMEFLKILISEIDLDSFIKPNGVYILDCWYRSPNINRYYANLEVFLKYDNIDEFPKEFLIEDEKAILSFTCGFQKYKIKFDPKTTDKNILFLLFNHEKLRKNNISTYNSCFICCKESKDLFFNCENIGPTCSHLICQPCSRIIEETNKDDLCEGCRRPLY